jgi:signal transduction histidine kinase
LWEINRDDRAVNLDGHSMANPNASVEICRSRAAVADETLIRASATAHDASLVSGQVRYLRPGGSSPRQAAPVRTRGNTRARTALGGASERRRLERDLHDGAQSELVALIVKLAVARQDPETPPALAHMIAAIEGHAQAALDSVRTIARGIYPSVLAELGLEAALRAQAALATVSMRLVGTAPRGTEEAEEAVYFACSEAIQNVVKHAGGAPRILLRFLHHHGLLVVRISDDGQGFDPDQASEGVGLQNIRDRIEDLGGTFELASRPGCGTVLTLELPWPTRTDRRR